MKKFKSPKLKCLNCKDIIWSHYESHFNVCKCWEESTKEQKEIFDKLDRLIPGLAEEYDGRWAKEPIRLATALGDKVKYIIREHIPNNGIFIDSNGFYTRTAGKYEIIGHRSKKDDK